MFLMSMAVRRWHEDTEEIDALLYSDSDDDHEEEEASTGHSLVEMPAWSIEDYASSTIPAKRRRVDVELDASLADTASSVVALADHCHDLHADCRNKDTSDDAESSCVRGGEKREVSEEKLENRHDSNHGNKRLKRARIQDTVGVLRRIISGGKGKDVANILDEDTRYLMSLKLKQRLWVLLHHSNSISSSPTTTSSSLYINLCICMWLFYRVLLPAVETI